MNSLDKLVIDTLPRLDCSLVGDTSSYIDAMNKAASAVLGATIVDLPVRPDKVVKRVVSKPFRIGRNERCFCGSDQKYKRCHGR